MREGVRMLVHCEGVGVPKNWNILNI
jgi:hypothetical protein